MKQKEMIRLDVVILRSKGGSRGNQYSYMILCSDREGVVDKTCTISKHRLRRGAVHP